MIKKHLKFFRYAKDGHNYYFIDRTTGGNSLSRIGNSLRDYPLLYQSPPEADRQQFNYSKFLSSNYPITPQLHHSSTPILQDAMLLVRT